MHRWIIVSWLWQKEEPRPISTHQSYMFFRFCLLSVIPSFVVTSSAKGKRTAFHMGRQPLTVLQFMPTSDYHVVFSTCALCSFSHCFLISLPLYFLHTLDNVSVMTAVWNTYPTSGHPNYITQVILQPLADELFGSQRHGTRGGPATKCLSCTVTHHAHGTDWKLPPVWYTAGKPGQFTPHTHGHSLLNM